MKVTQEIESLVFDLRAKNLTHLEIVKIVNLSRSTVDRILNPIRRDGYRKYQRENKKHYQEAYYENHELNKQKRLDYYYNNLEQISVNRKTFYLENRDEIRKQQKEYNERKETKNLINNYSKSKRKNNNQFRILSNLRSRLTKAMKGKTKSDKTLNLLGCSVNQLKAHLENQFLPNMNWGNYGFWGWHIDHIKSCCLFDLYDPEQQKICFHYTNLQPLWRIDNIKKGQEEKKIRNKMLENGTLV